MMRARLREIVTVAVGVAVVIGVIALFLWLLEKLGVTVF